MGAPARNFSTSAFPRGPAGVTVAAAHELEPAVPLWEISAHAGFAHSSSSRHRSAGAAAQAQAGVDAGRRRLAPAPALHPVALAHRGAASLLADRGRRLG